MREWGSARPREQLSKNNSRGPGEGLGLSWSQATAAELFPPHPLTNPSILSMPSAQPPLPPFSCFLVVPCPDQNLSSTLQPREPLPSKAWSRAAAASLDTCGSWRGPEPPWKRAKSHFCPPALQRGQGPGQGEGAQLPALAQPAVPRSQHSLPELGVYQHIRAVGGQLGVSGSPASKGRLCQADKVPLRSQGGIRGGFSAQDAKEVTQAAGSQGLALGAVN